MRRHPRLTTAAAFAVSAAVVALPASAGARGLTVKLPKSITEEQSFGYSWEGDTGPSAALGGGFIPKVIFQRGKKACPANAVTTAKTIAASGGSDNVFHPGAFRFADQTYISRSGSVRVCGYITADGNIDVAELFYDKLIKVKSRSRRAKFDLRSKAPKDGTYTAGPADILGGLPNSTVTFTIVGGEVTSVNAAGIPNTICSPAFRVQTPVPDAFVSTTAEFTGGNRLIGEGFGAKFVGNAPSGGLDLRGGGRSSKEIHGSLTEDSSDGSCRGGFGFIAKR